MVKASVCIGVELDRIPCVPAIETKMDNTKNVFTLCEFYIKIIIIYANLKLITTNVLNLSLQNNHLRGFICLYVYII